MTSGSSERPAEGFGGPPPVSEPSSGRTGLFDRRQGTIWAPIFLAPNLVLFSLFVVIPIAASFVLGFYRWDLLSDPEWVGLDNYARILSDPDARNSFWVTLVVVVAAGVPSIALGFLLAVAVNAKLPGIRLIRTGYFFPIVISLVASALLWRWVFDGQWGVLNWALGLVGIDGPVWLNDTTWALPAVIVVLIWKSIPLAMIIYLAALQTVSEELIDASRVDGAGRWGRIRHVQWPGVRPATVLVVIVTLIGLIFGSFDVVAVMTRGGGPLGTTETLSYFIYAVAFRDLELGYASAISVILFALIFVGTLVVFRFRGDEVSAS